MSREDIDVIWNRAVAEAIKAGEDFTLTTVYRFAALVAAAEREACAKLCDELAWHDAGDSAEAMRHCAQDIRARGKQ